MSKTDGDNQCLYGTFGFLRPYRSEDAPALQRVADDFLVVRWMSGFAHPFTLAQAKRWIEQANSESSTRYFVIEVDGMLVGGTGLYSSGEAPRGVALLGYWLGSAYWNRGIATAVVQRLVASAFENGFHRIEAHVFAQNTASTAVLRKCGFVLEGHLRDSYVDRDGILCDRLIFAKLRSDYE